MGRRSAERNMGSQHVLRVAMGSWFAISLACLGLSPAYPRIAADLAVTPAQLGALVGLGTLTSALLQIPSGVYADQLGLRRFIVLGMAAAAAMVLLLGLSDGAAVFGLSQVALGVAIPTLQAGSITAVAHVYAGARQASAMAYIWTSSSIGLAGSLVLYGVVGGAIGWRATALGLALVPLLVVPLALRMPAVADGRSPRLVRERLSESLRFLIRPRSLAIGGVSALANTSVLSAFFLVPFVLRDASFDSAEIGGLLLANVAGAVLGTPLIGRVADRAGTARPVMLVLACGACALAGLGFFATNAAVAVFCLLVIGAATNGSQAVLQSAVADLARELGVGTGAALGGMRLAQFVGPAVGPTIAGAAYLRWGGPATMTALALVLAIAAVGALRALSREAPPARPLGAAAV